MDFLSLSIRRCFSVARYGLSTALGLLAIIGLSLGGWALVLIALIVIATGSLLDEAIGDEMETICHRHSLFCEANLYIAAPLLVLITVMHMALVTRASSGVGPGLLDVTVATVLVGYLYAMIGATVAHELVHRPDETASVMATVLLAFMFNTSFTIFHLGGHHRYVAQWRDPASARRGETWIAFLVRTIWCQTSMAFELEAERLRRKQERWLSWHNRALRRQGYSIAVLVATWLLAGAGGVLAFSCAAFLGRALHELINYIQHYGLVRLEHEPVMARHTWNSRRFVSNALQYNLPRHAEHHLHAERAFWQLGADLPAPTLPYGYQTMAFIALSPRLWRRTMAPLLSDWDRLMASEGERHLVETRGWDRAF
jgi:hypothetical protein